MNRLTAASRIAVIGAGPSGLCAAHRFKQQGFTTKVFESAQEVGGTWRYSEDPKKDQCSSMYKNLRTNLPIKCMAFPDFPFSRPSRAFPSHDIILQYLKDYAEENNIMDQIQFSKNIEKVKFDEEKNIWEIEDSEYDFLIVANGHYSNPWVDEIFQNSDFQGEIIHTHTYRKPDQFAGKNILVIGQGPSGTDISIDLIPYAKNVTLLGRRIIPGVPEKITQVVGWPEKVSTEKVLTNTDVSIDCDVVILASGYSFDFSFLPEEFVNLNECKKKINLLYRQILHAKNPNLGFIGIPSLIVPFPLIDCQVRWLIETWKGHVTLPSEKERILESQKVPGCGDPKIPRHFHKMGPAQWIYNDMLAKEGGFDPIPRSIQELYTKVHKTRAEKGPVLYRDIDYEKMDSYSGALPTEF